MYPQPKSKIANRCGYLHHRNRSRNQNCPPKPAQNMIDLLLVYPKCPQNPLKMSQFEAQSAKFLWGCCPGAGLRWTEGDCEDLWLPATEQLPRHVLLNT